jgi:Predicted glycosyltransferases
MRAKIDIALVREGKLHIQGWAFGKDPESPVKIEAFGKDEEIKEIFIEEVERKTVIEAYFPNYEKEHGKGISRRLGFAVNVPYAFGEQEEVVLTLETEGQRRTFLFDDVKIERFNSRSRKKWDKLRALFQWETVEAIKDTVRQGGLSALFHKTVRKLRSIEEEYDYNEWQRRVRPTEEELERQREISRGNRFSDSPVFFSFVIPVYRPKEEFLRRLLDSILAQTYPHFEVCLADASDYRTFHKEIGKKSPKEVLEEYSQRDHRIRFQVLEENEGISGNTNRAIRMAEGDFIVFSDHDDELAPNALYEVVTAIDAHPEAELLYSDEDKIDFASAYYFEPNFKPDYSPEFLTAVNYICHLLIAKRSLLESVAEVDETGEKRYERKEYDGAQDYDLILRLSEAAEKIEKEEGLSKEAEKEREEALFTSSTIIHIPKVLYHWRSHQLSTAQNPEAKLYAFTAGERAVFDHYKRIGRPIRNVERGITYGYYHPHFRIEEQGELPLVSVIIPNKDHVKDLDQAIRSLFKGSYPYLEVIVVENNSEEKETFSYYEEIQKEFPARYGDFKKKAVRVVHWEREFNYSAINNFGVGFSHGDYLLFMNNDIEMLGEHSVEEMLQYVEDPEIGICGARLLYPDHLIQHGGVVMGFGGIAGASFIGLHETEQTYMHRAECIQNYSAVTAAVLLTKRKCFQEVGGFREELAVAFNDVDFCLKVRALGKRVVYTPYALFTHYESKSRGLEDNPEKVKRFNSEIVTLGKIWHMILRKGDPYYNPALTLRKANFALRDLEKEPVGEPFPLGILKGIV